MDEYKSRYAPNAEPVQDDAFSIDDLLKQYTDFASEKASQEDGHDSLEDSVKKSRDYIERATIPTDPSEVSDPEVVRTIAAQTAQDAAESLRLRENTDSETEKPNTSDNPNRVPTEAELRRQVEADEALEANETLETDETFKANEGVEANGTVKVNDTLETGDMTGNTKTVKPVSGEAGEDFEEPDYYDTGRPFNRKAPDPEKAAEKKLKRAKRRETFLAPIYSFLGAIAVRKERNKDSDKNKFKRAETVTIPELPPEKAAKFYLQRVLSIRPRAWICSVLTAIAFYLMLAANGDLPLFGVLQNARFQCLLMLILEFTAMVTALDLFTGGILSLKRGTPGFDTLVSVSCILTAVDTFLAAFVYKFDYRAPFCVVSMLTLTAETWGAYFYSKGLFVTFRTVGNLKEKQAVVVEHEKESEPMILKTDAELSGFVSHSEEADMSERLYAAIIPYLAILIVLLTILLCILTKKVAPVLHYAAAIASVSAPLSGALCFSLPFSFLAERLRRRGAAIAGWSGAGEIGNGKRLAIHDDDLFSADGISIVQERYVENYPSDKVLSYAAGVLCACGNPIGKLLDEKCHERGCRKSIPEVVEPSNGGGFSAVIYGERVDVGSGNYMNLIGVDIPSWLQNKYGAFVTINRQLVGIFSVRYRRDQSVGNALQYLTSSTVKPLLLLRDFNLSPDMIRTRFAVPMDSFEFPEFSQRFNLGLYSPENRYQPSAIISKKGLPALVECSDASARLYRGTRASTILSAVGTAIGMLGIFFMFLFEIGTMAPAYYAIVFLILWLIPFAVTARLSLK